MRQVELYGSNTYLPPTEYLLSRGLLALDVFLYSVEPRLDFVGVWVIWVTK